MSWSLLQRFIESDHFNNDPSLPVAYLSRYADHVGIQYVLCARLRRFSYAQIEFFLPQLCHLLVSIDNDSMALEEFIIDLCHESVSGALLTLWLFQTYLHDLANDPTSPSFRSCRRVFNKVQNIVFGAPELAQTERIYENILPVSALAGIILGAVAAPFFPGIAGPVAIGQARQPRPIDDAIPEPPPGPAPLSRSRSQTISGTSGRRAKHLNPRYDAGNPKSIDLADVFGERSFQPTTRQPSSRSLTPRPRPSRSHLSSSEMVQHSRLSSASLPDIHRRVDGRPTDRVPTPAIAKSTRPSAHSTVITSLANLSRHQKVRMLRSNYFHSETQFLAALEGISNRLVAIPKLARLSALRAELALIDQDLPAEVDIPLLCPATLVNGSPSQSKHHRVVRLSPAEATSLNSAERVPYLLMVEVLRDDFDFDPDTDDNQKLLNTIIAQNGPARRRLFDTTSAPAIPPELQSPPGIDSVYEPLSGDLSSSLLLQDFSDSSNMRFDPKIIAETFASTTATSHAQMENGQEPRKGTPSKSYRNFEGSASRNSSPASGNVGAPPARRSQAVNEPDFSALATHMRTAAQMLAQLELSGSKRPRHEVEAIKAKIIASMQSLEEQNFNDEISPSATLDTIMASVQPSGEVGAFDPDLDEHAASDVTTNAGAARMENDQKTGGVQRKGDRDDPSAATFGEEWIHKKERIRRSSPYGWMKNWDLLSVIVKTGSDLRQEAFACQLIQICARIWEDAGTPVWVKQMKILVTGESSGLIETITNGVSLHSLKRSLTLSTIASGQNPKKRIATLKDHFIKAFGEPETPAYKAAGEAFMRSLAAYSILSYVLQLKDRHNGNILIDNAGHIIHIDFGFMLSNSPGSVGFEAAPFKLTQDYVDVLGGVSGEAFEGFKTLCKQAFQALRKSVDSLVSVVDLTGKESKMACFVAGQAQTTAALRARFALHLSREEAESFVEDLVAKSLGSYYTRLYDTFQYRTQGIY